MTGNHVSIRIAPESRILPEHRIFVNRNLRMSSLRAIGFDLDHTLAHYRRRAVEELAYRLTQRRLVDAFGYPEGVLATSYDRDFVIRGLVVDKRRGHILKMDYHNYVARAYHGRRPLSTAERKSAYRTGRIRMRGGKFASADTLFHLPEIYLYAVLVDLKDEGLLGRDRTYESIYDDVRNAIDSIHGDGTLKAHITADPGKFVKRDPNLRRVLEEFRFSGKSLFLLTNSEYYYSDVLLKHLLESEPGAPSWGSLFDLIVVEAGKPGYFVDLGRPARGDEPNVPAGFPTVVRGGNARWLEQRLRHRGDEILYFGDHTYGDILRSKKTLGWRTAMVAEELESELAVTRRMKAELDELNHWSALRGVLEAEISEAKRRQLRLERKLQDGEEEAAVRARWLRRVDLLQARIRELSEDLAQAGARTAELGDLVHRAYNPYWGPLFREGRETSRFGHQVRDFACIYTTRVSNFLNYHPGHYFRSAEDQMPHEMSV